MRDLPHLVGQVFNTPLMIATPKLDTVLGAVGKRILAGEAIGESQRPEPRAEFGNARTRFEHGGYLCDGGIGVLPILGTLIRRGSWLDSWSGLTSYAAVSAAIYEMAESPSVRGIMLEVDSFGGEAGGCFDLVEEIVSVAATFEKPVWAIANEAAASAAYAIACAADRIWLPQMGVVGSVGVVCAHVDMSEADKMDGLKWTYIFAGDHKVDGNPHEPLPASVKSDLLADVNQIYHKFTSMVSERRGLSIDDVQATQARMYRGEQAINVGLADEVGTFAEAMNAFADHLNDTNTQGRHKMSAVDKQRTVAMAGKSKPQANAEASEAEQAEPKVPATEEGGEEASTTTEQAAAAAPPVVVTAAAAAPAAPVATAESEMQRAAELSQIAQFASKHGMNFDLTAAIKSRMSPADARKQVMDARASADEALPTVVTPTKQTAAASSHGETWQRAINRAAARSGIPVTK